MTLPCPNCGARLRVIVDDPELQPIQDDRVKQGIAGLSCVEKAIDELRYYISREDVLRRAIECPRCHGLLVTIMLAYGPTLADIADRDLVEMALVLAPDAQSEREGAS